MPFTLWLFALSIRQHYGHHMHVLMGKRMLHRTGKNKWHFTSRHLVVDVMVLFELQLRQLNIVFELDITFDIDSL